MKIRSTKLQSGYYFAGDFMIPPPVMEFLNLTPFSIAAVSLLPDKFALVPCVRTFSLRLEASKFDLVATTYTDRADCGKGRYKTHIS